MANLISRAYAQRHFNDSSFSSAEDTLTDDLLESVSSAVCKHCRRQFDSQTFDRLYDGLGQEMLLLDEYPIVSISRVAYDPTTVLEVSNTSSTNQRATVRTTSSGLSLVRVAGSTTTTSTLAFADADKDTLTELAAAVVALGSGWTARVVGDATKIGGRSSADLRDFQGPLNAKDVYAPLKLHVSELDDYIIDNRRGWLRRGSIWDRDCWEGGPQYWRVLFTAGYATVPEDVQLACALWCKFHYERTKRDGDAVSLIPATGDTKAWDISSPMPKEVERLLAPWRKRVL